MNQRPSPKQLAQARALIRADKQARKAARPVRVKQGETKVRRDRDEDYLGWLHEGLPCIGCLVVGPSSSASVIEAAHQKINAPSRGVFKRLGVRPSDWLCLPLCAGHHRLDPTCCDPAQAKFWREIGLEPEQVGDFCAALYRAFESESDGATVVRDFASLAAGNRADSNHSDGEEQ